MSGIHAHGHQPPLPAARRDEPEDESGRTEEWQVSGNGSLRHPLPVDADESAATGAPVLEAVGVTYAYADGTVALRDLSVAIPRGRRVAILGANGSGKSTLFLHFNGILRPAQGTILFDGQPVGYSRQGLNDLRRRVGLVFQDPDTQLFAASVRQDISFGPLNLGWPEDVVRAKVEQAICDTETGELADRPTHLLSYGQKKRVAIAGVLAMAPEVIIADEPTAGLDPAMTAQLMGLLDRLHEAGTTVVISTHDVELALAWADHVVVLRRGQVVGTGRPEAVFCDAALLRHARLVPPIVLTTYVQLCHCGVLSADAPVPRSATQLADVIAHSVAGCGDADSQGAAQA